MLKKKLMCFRLFLIIVAVFSFFFPLCADQVILDHNLSPGASSTNFIFLDNRLMELQNHYKDEKHNSFIKVGETDYFSSSNYYLNGPYYFSDSWDYRILKASCRFAEMGLVWCPLSYVTKVVQHEVFGHGYRIRDLGAKKVQLSGYTIQFKLTPWGLKLKNASTSYYPNPNTYNYSDNLLMAIGGVEANSILAHNLVMSWLSKGQVDGRQAPLWYYAYMNLPHYINSIRWIRNIEDAAQSGHDIAGYLVTLNYIYPYGGPGQCARLKNRALAASFLNPFTYIAAYSACSYVLFNSAVSIPSIPLHGMHFLPAYRLGLTPFGPEDIIEFFYWVKGYSPICVYWKRGEFSLNQYMGFGFECQKMALSTIGDFGLKLDLWHQPYMLSRISDYQGPVIRGYPGYEYYVDDIYKGYTHEELFGSHFGGALSIFYQKSLQNDPNTNLWLQLGYKTKGFLPGETYKHAPIVKVGVQTQF